MMQTASTLRRSRAVRDWMMSMTKDALDERTLSLEGRE